VPGARAFRRHLATYAVKPGAGTDVLIEALALIDERVGEPSTVAA
jgi:tRNA-dihydrouridine synthase A